MPTTGSARDGRSTRETLRLRDLALADADSIYTVPRAGEWMLSGLVLLVLLFNGLLVWHGLGAGSAAGRAIFFGLIMLGLIWGALVYIFKLSVSVRVGAHGLAVVRGPWRTELAWSEISRLVERAQTVNRQRYRWLVALAHDGRELRVREDMVADYHRFRMEVYERYRLWEDHGGTWGTKVGGAFLARDLVATEVTWWLIGMGLCALPGIYMWALLPGSGAIGPALLALGAVFAMLALRALLRRQVYALDTQAIEARRALRRPARLRWRDAGRVERVRHPIGPLAAPAIALGRGLLALTARTDARTQSFMWTPRVPEYLVLRGGGRQVRVRLHRLARPDELLAWAEFYERVARHGDEQRAQRTPAPAAPPRPAPAPSRPLAPAPPAMAEDGPPDPWAASRAAMHASQPGSRPRASQPPAPRAEDDAWLRETRAHAAPWAAPDARTPGAVPTSGAPLPSRASGQPSRPIAGAWPAPDAPAPWPTPPAPPAPQMPAPTTPARHMLGARPPTPPAHPVEPAPWAVPDEAPAEEGAATDLAGGLAGAFESWQADGPDAAPPPFPRFGPPLPEEREP